MGRAALVTLALAVALSGCAGTDGTQPTSTSPIDSSSASASTSQTVTGTPGPTSASPTATPTSSPTRSASPTRSNTSTATPAAFVVRLGAGDDGGAARVLRGGKVVVELPDPGGTRSAWFLQEGSVDLESVLTPYCAQWDTAMQHLQVMTLEAVAAGSVPLRLKYNLVESTAVPTDTFAVTVTVVDGPGALTPGTEQELVRVTADQAGSTVRLARNQRLQVELPSPSGDTLEWVPLPAEPQLVSWCTPQIEGPGSTVEVPGMTYSDTYSFTAGTPGTTPLRFTSTTLGPTRTFTVVVR